MPGQEEQKIMPSGAPLPQGSDQDDGNAGNKSDKKEGGGDGELLLGKYKSTEELVKAHEELQKKLGEQGSELGAAKKQMEFLMKQVESVSNTKEKGGKDKKDDPAPPDFNAQLAEIYQKMDKGELSVEEALQQSNAITAQMAEQAAFTRATEMFNRSLQERDSAEVRKRFLQQYPDFEELQQTGVFEEMKAKNPLHDDVSAYFELKAIQAFEQGKAFKQSLEEGAKQTDKVLNKPGSQIRDVKPKKTSDPGELKARMLARISPGAGG